LGTNPPLKSQKYDQTGQGASSHKLALGTEKLTTASNAILGFSSEYHIHQTQHNANQVQLEKAGGTKYTVTDSCWQTGDRQSDSEKTESVFWNLERGVFVMAREFGMQETRGIEQFLKLRRSSSF
jgi:hypothetical protein